MKNLGKLKTFLLERMVQTSKTIRIIEDESKKYSVDPASNGAYIGAVGYRHALRDLLEFTEKLDNGSEQD